VDSGTFYIIIGSAALVFCGGVCYELLRLHRADRLGFEGYERERFFDEDILCRAGYDPFAVVKQVARHAEVAVPELFIVPDSSISAGIIQIRKRTAIVCGKSFFLTISEREFEGVVGHEIGHLFGTPWHFHASYASVGFFASGFFLFIVALAAFGTPLVIPIELLSLSSLILAVACSEAYRVLQVNSEYAADRKALFLTRHPWDFIRLLSKTGDEAREHESGQGLLGIFSPKARSTHPPARKRVLSAKRTLIRAERRSRKE
jgi:Zn-dependent protease with chaperone function